MAKELFSEQTEKSLLGLLLSKPDLMKKATGLIESSDFYFTNNSFLYRALISSYSIHSSVDIVFVSEELIKISDKNVKLWIDYMAQLILGKGIESNLNKYISIIKEKKQTRELQETLKDSMKLVSEGGAQSVSELIGQVETKIKIVTKKRELKDFYNIKKLTSEFEIKIEMMKKGGYQNGIKTKITALDEKIGGLQGGQFIIIAARPSMGKTAFALEISKNISKSKNVGFFSLEMPADQLIARMISSETLLNSNILTKPQNMNGRDASRLAAGLEAIKKLHLWIDDSASLKISELSWKARKLSDLHQLDLIVIDYLQLIESESNYSDNRQQSISDISRQLKSLARELNIPVIALSQLSRRVEQREDKRPQMSDIRESGAIEQDADIIMFLYREDYYKNFDDIKTKPSSDLEVIISKHRNGPTGLVKLRLDLKHGKIETANTTYGGK